MNDVSPVDYSSSWVNNANQSNQQSLVEHTQFQSAESFFEPSVKESNSQFNIRDFDFGPDFVFDNWSLENQSVPVAVAAAADDMSPMSPTLDIFAPEPAPIDAGMLSFDFEISWNGVTSA